MKVKEAPEKIYIPTILAANTVRYKAEGSIEYIRTDAFINKACEWFRRIDYDDSMFPFETTEEFIEGFKKAMKL